VLGTVNVVHRELLAIDKIGLSEAVWRALGGTDGVIGLVILLNGILGFLQEAKAQDAVAALSKMTAPCASVVRDGQLMHVSSAELTCGDILVLAEGDAVAAEARLLLATSLQIDEASLTGESAVVLKDPAILQEALALGDRRKRSWRWPQQQVLDIKADVPPAV
jgi:P-type E1-E2 ATPase